MNVFEGSLQEASSGSESDNECLDYDNKPPILREIFEEERSYSEKLAIIAKEIYQTALIDGHTQGYNDLSLLSQELERYIGVSGEYLASLMGFVNFKAMCLNSSEIGALHTWKVKNIDLDGNITICEFLPIITDKHQKQVELQRPDTKKQRQDLIKRAIERIKQEGMFADDEELSFKLKMCKSLNAIGGLKEAKELGEWLKMHRRLFPNDDMNAESYRKFFKYKTKNELHRIVTERFFFEIASTTTPNGLRFKLLYPLIEIENYYNRVREARNKHFNELVERAQQMRIAKQKEEDEFIANLRFD